jgi:hypothetical protein
VLCLGQVSSNVMGSAQIAMREREPRRASNRCFGKRESITEALRVREFDAHEQRE